jgi:hypothetical protein
MELVSRESGKWKVESLRKGRDEKKGRSMERVWMREQDDRTREETISVKVDHITIESK